MVPPSSSHGASRPSEVLAPVVAAPHPDQLAFEGGVGKVGRVHALKGESPLRASLTFRRIPVERRLDGANLFLTIIHDAFKSLIGVVTLQPPPPRRRLRRQAQVVPLNSTHGSPVQSRLQSGLYQLAVQGTPRCGCRRWIWSRMGVGVGLRDCMMVAGKRTYTQTHRQTDSTRTLQTSHATATLKVAVE